MSTDVLDLRDLAERAEELETLFADPEEETGEEERQEYNDLLSLARDLVGTFEGPVSETLREYGENEPTMIHEGYWVTYAEELANDLGMLDVTTGDHPHMYGPSRRKVADEWPFRHIDWQAAAEELAQDYDTVTYAGETYLICSV